MFSPQLFDVNGTCFLSLVIESDEKFDLVARSKVTGVTAPCEGVHVEKYTPRTPFILVGYEPILQRVKGGRGEVENGRSERQTDRQTDRQRDR